MRRSQKVVLAAVGVVVLMAGGAVIVTSITRPAHQSITHARYYCPMHPNYTADHPGDCPICSMKLVKADEPLSTSPSDALIRQQGQAAPAGSLASVCYLHNCAKLHEGKLCPMTVVAKPGEKVTCPICGTHIAEAAVTTTGGSHQILYWTDPMIPGYKAPGPGKSPMGMDLVPVYEEAMPGGNDSSSAAPQGYAPVLLTPQKQQLIGVRTALIERKHLVKTVRAAGTIAHDPELYQAQAEYIHASQALAQATRSAVPEAIEQAQRVAQATRIRLKHLGLSDEMIQQIATSAEPEHGLLFAHPGDPVWMYAQVYEYELPLIHIGQEVRVDVAALPGQVFHGRVRAIDQMVEPMTRTTRIRAQLEDSQGSLKPDMYVNASILIDVGEVVAVPAEAVLATGEKQIVFVDKGQGLFEPRDVMLGAKADGTIELKTGAAEGERVVISGNFLIDSESRLKGALQGLSSSTNNAQPHETSSQVENRQEQTHDP